MAKSAAEVESHKINQLVILCWEMGWDGADLAWKEALMEAGVKAPPETWDGIKKEVEREKKKALAEVRSRLSG